MAVNFKNQRVLVNKLVDLSTPGKTHFPVELTGVIKAKDVIRLLGEELFGSNKEPKLVVTVDNALKVSEEGKFGLDRCGSGTVLLVPFFKLFGGFGGKKGSGKRREEEKGVEGVYGDWR